MSMETIRELAWTDYFLYAVTDPRELYRRIRQRDRGIFQFSFVVPVFIAFIDVITVSLRGTETSFFYHKISYGWLLILLFMLLKISVYSSLIDSSSQFFGQKGNIRDVLTLVNFSLFPKVFFLPLYYLTVITGFMPGFFYIFLSMVFFCWFMYVLVQGISEMNSITFGRSLGIAIMPAVVTGVLLFLMLTVMMISLAGYISA